MIITSVTPRLDQKSPEALEDASLASRVGQGPARLGELVGRETNTKLRDPSVGLTAPITTCLLYPPPSQSLALRACTASQLSLSHPHCLPPPLLLVLALGWPPSRRTWSHSNSRTSRFFRCKPFLSHECPCVLVEKADELEFDAKNVACRLATTLPRHTTLVWFRIARSLCHACTAMLLGTSCSGPDQGSGGR